jgi:hypothetical protein
MRCRRARCTRSGWPRPERRLSVPSIASWRASKPSTSRPRTVYSRTVKALLAFYEFPAEQWVHIRTTNVIESAFATIRHRSDRAKGCATRDSMLALLFKLGMSAQDSWRRLGGFEALAKVIAGVRFRDGVEGPAIGRKSAVSQARARTEQSRRLTPRHTPDLTIAPLGRSGSLCGPTFFTCIPIIPLLKKQEKNRYA